MYKCKYKYKYKYKYRFWWEIALKMLGSKINYINNKVLKLKSF